MPEIFLPVAARREFHFLMSRPSSTSTQGRREEERARPKWSFRTPRMRGDPLRNESDLLPGYPFDPGLSRRPCNERGLLIFASSPARSSPFLVKPTIFFFLPLPCPSHRSSPTAFGSRDGAVVDLTIGQKWLPWSHFFHFFFNSLFSSSIVSIWPCAWDLSRDKFPGLGGSEASVQALAPLMSRVRGLPSTSAKPSGKPGPRADWSPDLFAIGEGEVCLTPHPFGLASSIQLLFGRG